MSLLLCIVLFNFISIVSASFLIQDSNHTYSYPTYDPFAVKVDIYNISGVLITPTFLDLNHCTFKGNSSSFNNNVFSQENLANHLPLIVLVEELTATTAGCKTVAQISEAVYLYGQSLSKSNGLSIKAVLYILRKDVKGVPGGPFNTNYFSYTSGFLDGTPIIPMAMLPSKYNEEVLSRLSDIQNPIIVTVQQEEGPWNAVFFSATYVALEWILFITNILFILRGVERLVVNLFTNKFHIKKKTIVFIVALLSVLLYTSTILLNPATRNYQIVIGLSSLLFSIAFHLLQLAWCSIQTALDIRERTIILQIVIYTGCVLQSTAYFLQLLKCFAGSIVFSTYLDLSEKYIIMILQATGMVVFFYYGILFHIQKKRQRKHPITALALKQLSYMSFFCSVCLVFVTVYNTIEMYPEWTLGVSATIGRMLLLDISNTVRSFVLLCVLGLRIPGIESQETNIARMVLYYVLRKFRTKSQQEAHTSRQPSAQLRYYSKGQPNDIFPDSDIDNRDTYPSSFLHSNCNIQRHHQTTVI
ncbi:hypothetical protein BDF19DRAFT_174807 [Syncephalis fuscata]|nr:hypothetical protein BDF19DRAFT_174807 [Syncephalis fuscata]